MTHTSVWHGMVVERAIIKWWVRLAPGPHPTTDAQSVQGKSMKRNKRKKFTDQRSTCLGCDGKGNTDRGVCLACEGAGTSIAMVDIARREFAASFSTVCLLPKPRREQKTSIGLTPPPS